MEDAKAPQLAGHSDNHAAAGRWINQSAGHCAVGEGASNHTGKQGFKQAKDEQYGELHMPNRDSTPQMPVSIGRPRGRPPGPSRGRHPGRPPGRPRTSTAVSPRSAATALLHDDARVQEPQAGRGASAARTKAPDATMTLHRNAPSRVMHRSCLKRLENTPLDMLDSSDSEHDMRDSLDMENDLPRLLHSQRHRVAPSAQQSDHGSTGPPHAGSAARAVSKRVASSASEEQSHAADAPQAHDVEQQHGGIVLEANAWVHGPSLHAAVGLRGRPVMQGEHGARDERGHVRDCDTALATALPVPGSEGPAPAPVAEGGEGACGAGKGAAAEEQVHEQAEAQCDDLHDNSFRDPGEGAARGRGRSRGRGRGRGQGRGTSQALRQGTALDGGDVPHKERGSAQLAAAEDVHQGRSCARGAPGHDGSQGGGAEGTALRRKPGTADGGAAGPADYLRDRPVEGSGGTAARGPQGDVHEAPQAVAEGCTEPVAEECLEAAEELAPETVAGDAQQGIAKGAPAAVAAGEAPQALPGEAPHAVAGEALQAIAEEAPQATAGKASQPIVQVAGQIIAEAAPQVHQTANEPPCATSLGDKQQVQSPGHTTAHDAPAATCAKPEHGDAVTAGGAAGNECKADALTTSGGGEFAGRRMSSRPAAARAAAALAACLDDDLQQQRAAHDGSAKVQKAGVAKPKRAGRGGPRPAAQAAGGADDDVALTSADAAAAASEDDEGELGGASLKRRQSEGGASGEEVKEGKRKRAKVLRTGSAIVLGADGPAAQRLGRDMQRAHDEGWTLPFSHRASAEDDRPNVCWVYNSERKALADYKPGQDVGHYRRLCVDPQQKAEVKLVEWQGRKSPGKQLTKSCHICQRQHIFTNDCKKNNKQCPDYSYCRTCLQTFFPGLSFEELTAQCPFCRGLCSCKRCQRSAFAPRQPSYTHAELASMRHYVLRLAAPHLHRLLEEEDAVAQAAGLSCQEELPVEVPPLNERVLCDFCATSIHNLHWSCQEADCGAEMCMGCARILADGCAPAAARGGEDGAAAGGQQEAPRAFMRCPNKHCRTKDGVTGAADGAVCPQEAPAAGAAAAAAVAQSDVTGPAKEAPAGCVDPEGSAKANDDPPEGAWTGNGETSEGARKANGAFAEPRMSEWRLRRFVNDEDLKVLRTVVKTYMRAGDVADKRPPAARRDNKRQKLQPAGEEEQPEWRPEADRGVQQAEYGAAPSGKKGDAGKVLALWGRHIPLRDVRRVRRSGPDDDAYMWTPHADMLQPSSRYYVSAARLFQQLWRARRPVVVRELSWAMRWDPAGLRRAARELGNQKFKTDKYNEASVVDCSDLSMTEVNLSAFFNGYVGTNDRLSGRMLKLKDWPPDDDFHLRLVRHNQDFQEMLPMAPYSRTLAPYLTSATGTAPLNLATLLREGEVPTDLGPKSYIAYGRAAEHEQEGDSCTKLHQDMSDAVNVLLHCHYRRRAAKGEEQRDNSGEDSEDGAPPAVKAPRGRAGSGKGGARGDGEGKAEDKGEDKGEGKGGGKKVNAVERAAGKEDKSWKGEIVEEDVPRPRFGKALWEVARYGNAGAVWDIFPADRVEPLRAFLRRHRADFKHAGRVLDEERVGDEIFDQVFMLREKQRAALLKEEGLEAWHFEQHVGEAVFIPGGCPHQVRNLRPCVKVAVDFVSPEALAACGDMRARLADVSFRRFGRDKDSTRPPQERFYAEKLQARLLLVHGVLTTYAELHRPWQDEGVH